MTIGAGPGTDRTKQMEHTFPFGYSGWQYWNTSQNVRFILEIFQSGEPI